MASAAQVVASRLNGALSHGPTSEDGKATSSLNALKTGLTGRTVLLPVEGAAHDLARAAGLTKETIARLEALVQ